MENSLQNKKLYIVITQTGTVLSRILKFITKAKYNHASLSLLPNLNQMYSFGRKNAYNPFWAGFIMESPNTGTFKRFSKTRAVVLAVDISSENYEKVCEFLKEMYIKRRHYGYNYMGLYLAALHIIYKKKNRYYCSEFVRDILLKCKIEGAENLSPIIKPIDFLSLPHTQIYEGMLKEYIYHEIKNTV